MHNQTEERRKHPRVTEPNLIKLDAVKRICGLSRASIYGAVKLGTFPPPVKLTGRASAWVKEEVDAWVQQRIAISRRKGITPD